MEVDTDTTVEALPAGEVESNFREEQVPAEVSQTIDKALPDNDAKDVETKEVLNIDENINEETTVGFVRDSNAEASQVISAELCSAPFANHATPSVIISTNLPPKLIRIAVNDEFERLRITSSVSSFLEEVVEGNVLKSKYLLKVTLCIFLVSSIVIKSLMIDVYV